MIHDTYKITTPHTFKDILMGVLQDGDFEWFQRGEFRLKIDHDEYFVNINDDGEITICNNITGEILWGARAITDKEGYCVDVITTYESCNFYHEMLYSKDTIITIEEVQV